MTAEMCLGTSKAACFRSGKSPTAGLAPLLAARRDPPLLKPLKTAILATKPPESGECRLRVVIARSGATKQSRWIERTSPRDCFAPLAITGGLADEILHV